VTALTLFGVPKAFDGHIGIIQSNAIHSWARLPDCEIMLLGTDAGTREMAEKVGATWIGDVARNSYGTPLLDSVFAAAANRTKSRLICYVNSDIILLPDFLDAIARVRFDDFLMLGRRWDIDVTRPLDFTNTNWRTDILDLVGRVGKLFPPIGSDFFVFPAKSPMAMIPPFAVGRPAWDNWFIHRARSLGLPVVDATFSTTVVHQNHGYSHVHGRRGAASDGLEGDQNRTLAGNKARKYDLIDSTHMIVNGRVRPALGWLYLRRRFRRARHGLQDRMKEFLGIGAPP
jgi:hypothetical protein